MRRSSSKVLGEDAHSRVEIVRRIWRRAGGGHASAVSRYRGAQITIGMKGHSREAFRDELEANCLELERPRREKENLRNRQRDACSRGR